MRMVGLTGGIASGKSSTAREFHTLGLPIIDADKVAHAALKKGTLAWRRVVSAFGEGVLLENGEVNRARLGEIIFSDPAKRKVLNSAMSFSITIGIFWEIFEHWIKGTKVVILDVPLLYETFFHKITKPNIVVWVDHKTEEERLMKRDGISEEQAIKKIKAQLPLDWKRDKADIVIDNSGTMDDLKEQVRKIHAEITSPLTWKEHIVSRSGVLSMLALTTSFFILRK